MLANLLGLSAKIGLEPMLSPSLGMMDQPVINGEIEPDVIAGSFGKEIFVNDYGAGLRPGKLFELVKAVALKDHSCVFHPLAVYTPPWRRNVQNLLIFVKRILFALSAETA